MSSTDTRKAKTGVFSAGRALIKERTLRTDKWWIQPLITVAVFVSFIIYATFRAFEKQNYFNLVSINSNNLSLAAALALMLG
jgi:uncharacterized membrane protein